MKRIKKTTLEKKISTNMLKNHVPHSTRIQNMNKTGCTVGIYVSNTVIGPLGVLEGDIDGEKVSKKVDDKFVGVHLLVIGPK